VGIYPETYALSPIMRDITLAQNWLASSFGACNEMPEVPAREHRYGEVLRGMCCSADPNL
jgi:hypothetical protein